MPVFPAATAPGSLESNASGPLFDPGLGLLSACASHSISYINQRGHQKTYGMFRLLVHVEWKHVALADALYDRILTQVTELTFVCK